MKVVKVNLKQRAYKIFIGRGVVKKIGSLLKESGLTPQKYDITIITSENVQKNCNGKLTQFLKNERFNVENITINDAERNKNLKTYFDIINTLSKLEKNGTRFMLIAFGGGVISDITGFVAATYRRGIPYVVIPTTLLGQIDSGIGGKTGVDLKNGKNLVGAIYQPKLVINDSDFLKTLKRREIKSAMAEMIKYAIIEGEPLFSYLEKNLNEILTLSDTVLEHMIYECCQIKAKIVEKDEFDNIETIGIRAKLNLGHTIAHAIEASTNYKAYTHGEAVAIGILCESLISNALGLLPNSHLKRIKELIQAAGLPHTIHNKNILPYLRYDKKFSKEKVRFSLPIRIGDVRVIEDIPEKVIVHSVNKILA